MLEVTLLAYLLNEPRTGRELIDDISRDLGATLSPGMVYPLLTSLEKRGLLTSLRRPRSAVYRPTNPDQARDLVSFYINNCMVHLDYLRDISRCASRRL